MSTRKLSVLLACIATLAATSSAMAQDTTRTRDSLARQMQMQPPARMMTGQARDSLIRQLLDSANRVTDPAIARRLRDSVTTLRALAVRSDTANMRMQTDTMMTRRAAPTTPRATAPQQRQATSDQRVRVQKDSPARRDSLSGMPPSSTSRL